MTGKEVLDLPMKSNDADAKTVREYLIALLSTLLREEDGFSGKRPFGNSGWVYDLYSPLVLAGAVSGSHDQEGYLDTVDTDAADKLLQEAVSQL